MDNTCKDSYLEEQKKHLLEQYDKKDVAFFKEIVEEAESFSFHGTTIVESTSEVGTNG